MKALLLLQFFAVASANYTTVLPAEQQELPGKIITNGYTVPTGQAPYIVFLSFEDTFCGGSIIGNSWILTASHCTKPYNRVTIYYGSMERAQGQVVHTVWGNDIINHPTDDIALIRTPHVNFSNSINRVLLPQMSDRHNQYVNHWGLACGWGETTTTKTPQRLQCVNLRVISYAQCRQIYSEDFAKPQILCVATSRGRSTCYGDSGGPLVHNNRLIGVSNFVSEEGCTSRRPAGFARVTSHLDWIHQQTGISY